MEGLKKGEPPLVDQLLQNGKLAFDPYLPEETRQQNRPMFMALLDSTSTLTLLPILNLLVQPGRTQPWLRAPIISALALLPLRPRGVQDTIEFILSAHPSSRRNDTSGANNRAAISHEALNAASRLLSSPPTGMSPEKWFSGIASQLFSLLQGEGEHEMDKAASFIIGFGVLGRKIYGAPGMPGWKSFVDPILRNIDPTLAPKAQQHSSSEEAIITLGVPKVLVSSLELEKSIRNLSTLLTSHPHPSLAKRILTPILLPLWSLASWSQGSESTKAEIRKPAKELLKILLQLWPSPKDPTNKSGQLQSSYVLPIILHNLMFKGRSDSKFGSWEYATADDGGIQIQEPSHNTPNELDFDAIDSSTDRFIAFIALINSTLDFSVEISNLFMELCSKWLSDNSRIKKDQTSIVTHLKSTEDNEDVMAKLIYAKVMQKMMTAFPDKLVSDSQQLLELVRQVLSDFTDNFGGGSDGDAVSVALSLLNIVLTAPNFRMGSADETLKPIETSLQSISRMRRQDVSPTAQNLLLLLKYRETVEEPEDTSLIKLTDQQFEDRKGYLLALSYLTGLDSPPPVRAQGLELLSSLVLANSSVLDIPALLVLYSSLLQDTEEYIYLRAIQSFIQLSQRHPKAVMKDLVDRYVDPTEEYELDQRLRLGEALLQVIQKNFLAFTGEIATSVCEGLLFIASRRGYRPKTELQQEKRNKLKRKQNEEADEVWGGSVPQLDDVLENQSHQDDEILAQITSGWESKRGSEDIRIRASATSILGSAIESNISGLTSRMVSTSIDLSIHILTLEPELEKGILRRSAILLIMHFVKALDSARSEGKKLGFGFVGKSLEDVQRILTYVESSDNDGLVRQHARDVVEGLQAWQINALLPVREERTEIVELAGLTIKSRGDVDGMVRPRIEEIE